MHQTLAASDFSPKQVTGLVSALDGALRGNLATSKELLDVKTELKQDISMVRLELHQMVNYQLFVIAGMLTALVTLGVTTGFLHK